MAFPLALLAAPAIAGLAGQLLGGSSSAEKKANQMSGESAALQLDNLKNQAGIRDTLKDLARGPSAKRGIMNSTGGLGFRVGDSFEDRSNIGDILHNIDFNALKKQGDLSGLLGQIPSDQSAIQMEAQRAAAKAAEKRQAISNVGSAIGGMGGGGAAGGAGIFSQLFGKGAAKPTLNLDAVNFFKDVGGFTPGLGGN